MRVLVRAPNWLGDIVMALPAIAGIRRHFRSDLMAVAAPASLSPLFSAVPGVDVLVPLENFGGRSSAWAWHGHAQMIAQESFDIVVLLPNSFHVAWVAKWAGVPERWGYRTDLRGWLLTKKVSQVRHQKQAFRHHSEYYQDLIRGLGIEPLLLDPQVTVPAEVHAQAQGLLEQYGCYKASMLIGIAPGAAYGHAKRWLPNRYAELIGMLQREFEATCILVGSKSDRDAGSAIESELTSMSGVEVSSNVVRSGNRLVNLIGKTDLLGLIGVLSCCRTVVSNDSGAMHLAAAIGQPVTAIFGPTDERVTAPLGNHHVLASSVWCRPCMLRECPIDHRCMTDVSVRMVYEAVVQQM